MKTVAIGVARMNSSRLPGKVLRGLGGKPVLAWVVRSLRATVGVDEIWIATTTSPKDDRIAAWCFKNGVRCHRGSETDVLARVHDAAVEAQADVIAKVTCDEPFLDPAVTGAVIRLQKETGTSYASNTSPRTFPDGYDTDVFTFATLEAAHKEATRAIDRDSVCPWMTRNQSRFPAETLINPIGNKASERWVMDTAEDYEFCRAIAERLPWHKGPPSQLDILAILDKEPELRAINAGGVMNERYFDACAQEPLYERSFPRSQAFFERTHNVIPLAAQTFSKSFVQFPQPSPLFLSHGEGGKVWDVDGHEYIDLVSALLPNILGYRDPDVDAAIRRQLCRGISYSLATELEVELAETLCRLIPCAESVRYGKNGSDVTSAAIRLARAYTGKDRIIKFRSHYHGWHDALTERTLGVPSDVLNLTYISDDPGGILPVDKTLSQIDDEYAAVICEPYLLTPTLLQFLRRACDGRRTLLIFDEIISGFRYHLGGYQAMCGVTPDLACVGKSMGNGMPISAIVGRKDIMRRMEPPGNIFYSGTFQGEALSLAAAIATIAKLERENVIEGLWDKAAVIRERVLALIREHGLTDHIALSEGDPLVRITFKPHATATADQIKALFMREMIKTGVLIIAAHNTCHAHDANDLKRLFRSWDHALRLIAKALAAGDIGERLGNTPVPERVSVR